MEMIAAERRRLADLVDGLDTAQLQTRSLCEAWTVKQVVGHLVAVVTTPGTALGKALLRSGLRLHRANARLAVHTARRPARELAALLRAHAETPMRPPIVGYRGALTDLQVHSQDIRRPLGLPDGLDPDRVRVSLAFLTGRWAIGFTPARRVASTIGSVTSAGRDASQRPMICSDSPAW